MEVTEFLTKIDSVNTIADILFKKTELEMKEAITMIRNKKSAQTDFDLLKIEFKEIKGDDNSDEMYQKLLCHFNGFNDTCNELFDFDYRSLTATIVKHKGIIELSDDVEFYENEDCAPDKFFLQRVS